MAQDSPQPQSSQPRKGAWMVKALIGAGVLVLLALLAAGFFKPGSTVLKIGDPVPDFTLTGFDGQETNTADLRGKVIVVNLWASWCGPCGDEARLLEEAWQQFRKDGNVVFLGVDYMDTEPEALDYLQKYEVTYPNGPDLGGAISKIFHATGVPETYIIDPHGNLSYIAIGPFSDLDDIVSAISASRAVAP